MNQAILDGNVDELDCPSSAYVAGFVDGEGTIYYSEASKSIQVSVSNTYGPIIEAIARKYGGAVNTTKYSKKPHWKLAYVWRASGRRAARFLTDIEPFLVQKRGRAQAALTFLDTMCWPRPRHELTPDILSVRHVVLSYLKHHPNARGGRGRKGNLGRKWWQSHPSVRGT